MATGLFTEKFTTHLKQALIKAQILAINEITTDNLLDALAQEKGSIAAEIINKARRAKIETDVEELRWQTQNKIIVVLENTHPV